MSIFIQYSTRHSGLLPNRTKMCMTNENIQRIKNCGMRVSYFFFFFLRIKEILGGGKARMNYIFL